MSDQPLQVLAVVGSLNPTSVTRSVLLHLAERLRADGCSVDVLDLEKEPLPLYNPDTAYDAPGFDALQPRVERADVYLLGTPDYHGGISGAMKNFLDHFWREFAGKLFATVVASHEKGLTVTDQLRTVARSVGIAGGQRKHEAIRGALAGGWINVLITDLGTAEALIARSPNSHVPAAPD